jgi:hypothetical protein
MQKIDRGTFALNRLDREWHTKASSAILAKNHVHNQRAEVTGADDKLTCFLCERI